MREGKPSHLRSVLAYSWLALVLLLVAGCDHLSTKEAVQAPSPPPVVVKTPPPPPPPTIVERAPALPPPPVPESKPAERPDDLPTLAPGQVRVALLLPLSGRLAEIGKGMLNAAQLALFDVADNQLELVPYDTGDSTAGAVTAAKKAVDNQVSLMLGPLLSTATKAVRPVASAAHIPVISYSSDRSVGGDGVFVMGFIPETEIERVMTFAADNGASRFVVLGPKDTYGDAVATAAKKVAKERNLTLVRVELYDPKTTNFGLVVDRIRTLQPDAPQPLPPAPPAGNSTSPPPLPTETAPPPLAFDALLIADGGDRLRALATQLAAKGIGTAQVRLLGTGAWDEPSLAKEPSLAGAWIAAPEPSFRQEFEDRYRQVYGKPPPRLATLGYDSTALAAVLARDRGREGHTQGWLANPDGFFGRDGLFRLMPEGYADRRLAVLQIAGDQTGVISEAPRRFSGF